MQRIDLDHRQLRIILHALTMLNLKDAIVDDITIGGKEFDALMDKVSEHIGAELRQREQMDQENLRKFMVLNPEAERRHDGVEEYKGPHTRKGEPEEGQGKPNERPRLKMILGGGHDHTLD